MLTPEKQGAKLATRALVRAVGGQEACPGFARYTRHQSYSEFASIEQADKFMPLDVIIDLEAVTHGTPAHPAVTSYLCELAGGVFVRKPDPRDQGGDLHTRLAALAKEHGELMAALLPRLQGGLSAAEVRDGQLVREGRDMIASAIELVTLIEAIEAGE